MVIDHRVAPISATLWRVNCFFFYRSSIGHFLSVCRGRGFASLVGAADTRGERGIVAVAERAGGRVRLLHYAPALPPFYRAELTHLHRLVETFVRVGTDRRFTHRERIYCPR